MQQKFSCQIIDTALMPKYGFSEGLTYNSLKLRKAI